MGLIERAEQIEAERRRRSQDVYGHTGASIPGLWLDWRSEALSLEVQLAEAVEALDAIIEMADRADSPSHSMQGRTNAWANLGSEAVRIARAARGQ